MITHFKGKKSDNGQSSDLYLKSKGIANSHLLNKKENQQNIFSPSSLKIEFVNGTVCDIDNKEGEYLKRATTLELSCGIVDEIIDVQEDKTCHYHVKVSLVSLCNYPDFKPIEKKVILYHYIYLLNN